MDSDASKKPSPRSPFLRKGEDNSQSHPPRRATRAFASPFLRNSHRAARLHPLRNEGGRRAAAGGWPFARGARAKTISPRVLRMGDASRISKSHPPRRATRAFASLRPSFGRGKTVHGKAFRPTSTHASQACKPERPPCRAARAFPSPFLRNSHRAARLHPLRNEGGRCAAPGGCRLARHPRKSRFDRNTRLPRTALRQRPLTIASIMAGFLRPWSPSP
jgi:hypothetical protein